MFVAIKFGVFEGLFIAVVYFCNFAFLGILNWIVQIITAIYMAITSYKMFQNVYRIIPNRSAWRECEGSGALVLCTQNATN